MSQIPHIAELLVYFFADLQNKICSQIRPHDPKDSILAMEIAREVEDSMKDARSGRGVLYRNNNSNFLYQGGTRVVSRTKTFKGVGSSQVASNNDSNARKEGNGTTYGSNIGGNSAGGLRNRGSRGFPYTGVSEGGRKVGVSIIEGLIVQDTIVKKLRIIILVKKRRRVK